MFKPVMPQRRKHSSAGEPTIKQESTSSVLPAAGAIGTASGATSGSSSRGGRSGRRAAHGGRGGKEPIEMVASGPFAMGTGSISRYERRRLAGSSGAGPSVSSGGKWESNGLGGGGDRLNTKSDPDVRRSSYRDPDRLQEKEKYSDQEEGVEVVDIDDVADLDALAPRSLPRVQEKEKKSKKQFKTEKHKRKGKGTSTEDAMDFDIKPRPDDEEAMKHARLLSQGSAVSTQILAFETKAKKHEPDSDKSDEEVAPEETAAAQVRSADALDLSESEQEEMMDDLVDDFVFDNWDNVTSKDAAGGTDTKRLYLFQFPQMFPSFKVACRTMAATPSQPSKPEGTSSILASSSALPGCNIVKSRRSVAFADFTANGSSSVMSSSDLAATKPKAVLEAKSGESAMKGLGAHEESAARAGPEGLIGRLQVYRDGRVEMHFDRGDDVRTGHPRAPLIMEVAGGSQPTFLQDVALLDAESKKAHMMGEVHRKFTVSPSVDGMLTDAAQYEDRMQRLKQKQEAASVGLRNTEKDDFYDDSSSDESGDDGDRKPVLAKRK